MSESNFPLDERNVATIHRVGAVMYIINVFALTTILFYRQFVLHQSVSEFNDIANLMVFNAVFFLGAILFFGGIPFRRIRLVTLLFLYLAFVALGLAFTAVKYFIILDEPFSWGFVLDKSLIIVVICAAVTLIYALFAYLGHRRTEREIEE